MVTECWETLLPGKTLHSVLQGTQSFADRSSEDARPPHTQRHSQFSSSKGLREKLRVKGVRQDWIEHRWGSRQQMNMLFRVSQLDTNIFPSSWNWKMWIHLMRCRFVWTWNFPITHWKRSTQSWKNLLTYLNHSTSTSFSTLKSLI